MAIGQNMEVAKVTVEKNVEKAKAKAQAHAQTAVAIVKSGQVKAQAHVQTAAAMVESAQGRALVLAKDPQFRTITISTAGGAIVLGSVGGAFGTASGIVVGAAAGVVPALFTFGLSIPIGAVVGGSTGFCVGTATGAGTGAAGGAVAGFAGYKYRVQIKDGLVTVQKKALAAHGQTKAAAGRAIDTTKAKVVVIVDGVRQKSLEASKFTKARAGEFAVKTQQVVSSDKFKVTAASASAGAVVGGSTGAMVGGTAGAALGLIPALFTFGLSIPVGAMVGGCVGAASGTVTGAVGAGTAGYGSYTYRKEIRSGAETLVTTVKAQTASAKGKLVDSASKVNQSIKFYSGTGGTAA